MTVNTSKGNGFSDHGPIVRMDIYPLGSGVARASFSYGRMEESRRNSEFRTFAPSCCWRAVLFKNHD
jgi:hypothetical protein